MTPSQARDPDSETMDYDIVQCANERELIERFVELVKSEDPDVVTGHYIWNFDMKYLYIRAQLMLHSPMADMGRTQTNKHTELTSTVNTPNYKKNLRNADFVERNLGEDGVDCFNAEDAIYTVDTEKSKIKSKGCRKLVVVDGQLTLEAKTDERTNVEVLYDKSKLGSASTPKKRANNYSRNKIHSFVMEGRVVLDTLPASKERKMDTYTLQNLCSTLMGKSKLDVTAKDMFKAYRLAILCEPTDEDALDMATCDDEAEHCRSLYDRVIYYCVKDSDLVLDLFECLNTWTAVMEYAKCFGVTPYESLACGEQARCLSIVYVMASNMGYVLDHPQSLQLDVEPFVGGRVVTPVPGVYDYVMCFDFNSLYPSIIQEKNICHTTYIPKSRWGEFAEGEYVALVEREDEGGGEFRFSTRNKGIIPNLCEFLVRERKAVKRQMAEISPSASKETKHLVVCLDCRQKALKITANSMYGLMGADVGALKLLEGSRSITCRGRALQRELSTALRDEFDTVEIYGDTDSSMVTGRGNVRMLNGSAAGEGLLLRNPRQAFALGRDMERYLNGSEGTSGYFRYPIRVEMEKVMKMLVAQKKMYAYMEYSNVDGDSNLFMCDSTGEPRLTSKGLLSARRDSCSLCKRTFEATVKKVFADVKGHRLLLEVASMLRKFLLSNEVSDFIKTVEIAGQYSSKTCANSVFKNNMLRLGTKIDPKSRVSYVLIVTDKERNGGHESVGNKMLLVEHFDDTLHVIDKLQYLSSGLKSSLDTLVATWAHTFQRTLLVPTLGNISLNRPIDSVIKLVTRANSTWDVAGIDLYETLVKKEAARMRAD